MIKKWAELNWPSWIRWFDPPGEFIDPPGWDEKAQRTHDVEPMPEGLFHYSNCWCRRAEEVMDAAATDLRPDGAEGPFR